MAGEARTYADAGTRPLMERQGFEVIVLDEPKCVALIEAYASRR